MANGTRNRLGLSSTGLILIISMILIGAFYALTLNWLVPEIALILLLIFISSGR
jgi:hypothetical protein